MGGRLQKVCRAPRRLGWGIDSRHRFDVTEKFATEAMNLLAQPVRGGAQNHDARSQPTGKPADKEVLRGYVERVVEEKLAGQRKQTPRKTRPPRGRQGSV